MHYNGLVATRAAARVLGIVLVAALTPFLLPRLDWNRPGPTSALILLTIRPLLVSNRCLRFLGEREAQYSSPTSEMQFIFGLAISVPLVITAATLIA